MDGPERELLVATAKVVAAETLRRNPGADTYDHDYISLVLALEVVTEGDLTPSAITKE